MGITRTSPLILKKAPCKEIDLKVQGNRGELHVKGGGEWAKKETEKRRRKESGNG
jgi:hypothetical protein